MNKSKTIAIGVSGLLALGVIHNAIHSNKTEADTVASKPIPAQPAIALHPVTKPVAKPKPVKVAYKGDCNPYICIPVCKPGSGTEIGNPTCDKALALYDRKQKAQEDAAAAKATAKAAKSPNSDKPNNDCSSQATALALAAALSGNIQTAIGAGKIAANTAGTGQKC